MFIIGNGEGGEEGEGGEGAGEGQREREREKLPEPHQELQSERHPLPPTTQNELTFTIIDFLICINLHQPIDFREAITFLFCFVFKKGRKWHEQKEP